MSYSENIKYLREKYNFTQAELAKFAGVSQQAIDRMEKGIMVPNAFTAIEIARKFNTTVEELMCGKSDKREQLYNFIKSYVNSISETCGISKDKAAQAMLKAFKENATDFNEMFGAEIKENEE